MIFLVKDMCDGPRQQYAHRSDSGGRGRTLWQVPEMAESAGGNGLRLFVKKTGFLSSEEGTGSIIDGHGEAIEKVRDFRYLARDLAANGRVDQAVKAWMNADEVEGVLRYHLRPSVLQDSKNCIRQW
ncbi:unnamed protein product [Haemonchus placei]|uniref:Death domain-containing protein n=1 Tax=Haemonchus placei TaxID=6290 RepID=A0A0N4WDR4_HAEPC|nr:unnamed protein product [Haemonchus placei]